MNKSILIIGGMGHFASVHVHKQLLRECIRQKKDFPTIVHVSVEVVPFHSDEMRLEFSHKTMEILRKTDCDVGIIACNTAHLFFEEIQKLTPTPLIHAIEQQKMHLQGDELIVCSPISRKSKLYGSEFNYLSRKTDEILSNMIRGIDEGKSAKLFEYPLRKLVKDQKFVAACSEISLIADECGIPCINPMQNTLQYNIVREYL